MGKYRLERLDEEHRIVRTKEGYQGTYLNEAKQKLLSDALRLLGSGNEAVRELEYEIVGDNFDEAKKLFLKELPYMVYEKKGFPTQKEYFSKTLWTIAEYEGEHGEKVRFTREGTTRIDFTAQVFKEYK